MDINGETVQNPASRTKAIGDEIRLEALKKSLYDKPTQPCDRKRWPRNFPDRDFAIIILGWLIALLTPIR